MCQRATCSRCGKPSYVGCGRHVEKVLADVPPAERCHCREEGKRAEPRGWRALLEVFRSGRPRREP